jgi:hypothetical protein
MSRPRSKTLDSQPVRALVHLLLQARRLRGLRRQHWVATLTVHGQLLVLEQQRFPSLPQVPFHVEGQRAQNDVRPHSIGRAVLNWTHEEIDALEASINDVLLTLVLPAAGVHRERRISEVPERGGLRRRGLLRAGEHSSSETQRARPARCYQRRVQGVLDSSREGHNAEGV